MAKMRRTRRSRKSEKWHLDYNNCIERRVHTTISCSFLLASYNEQSELRQEQLCILICRRGIFGLAVGSIHAKKCYVIRFGLPVAGILIAHPLPCNINPCALRVTRFRTGRSHTTIAYILVGTTQTIVVSMVSLGQPLCTCVGQAYRRKRVIV